MRRGDRTPPCGAPVAVGQRASPSITPALSQAVIIRLKAGKVWRVVRRAW